MPWPEALIAGTLIALAFAHRTGWTPGGLITPGYLVIYLGDWRPCLLLILIAALTLVAALAMRRWLPLYGRRRWAFCVGTAVMLRAVAEAFVGSGATPPIWDPLGLVVPGLIASAALQQGLGQTLTGLITVTAATWWTLILVGLM
jgi:poly-gamma-glutamate biosynthesis protein PgsC/CapC